MRLIAKFIRISRARFHCSRLTTVQDIQDYASLIFWTQCRYRREIFTAARCGQKCSKMAALPCIAACGGDLTSLAF